MQHPTYEQIAVSESGIVATIEIRRGPNNFINTDMVGEIADALEVYDRTPGVRAIVLCSEGKHFCAGADFQNTHVAVTHAGTSIKASAVRYIVTEFGAVNLHGKTVRERALALIGIAHPQFREELLEVKSVYCRKDERRKRW